MARFQLNILGCGSATPARHLPTSQVIDYRDKLFMIDCGEGAQLAMRRMRLKFSRINHVFLSHLHGDHCFGLPGLLSTLSLHQKQGTVMVHTFKEGVEMFGKIIDFFCRDTSFEIKFNVIEEKSAVIYENDAMTVETFPLYHRVPCVGFIFREKPKLRHLRGDMVKFYNVPVKELYNIKNGADFVTHDGIVIANEWLTTPADQAMSYAYCSDTIYDERVIGAVKGVDVIYHEATYTDDYAATARERGHSTASEAARVAKLAGASRLILGHYSKRYLDETAHLEEARAIFPNVIAADEGMRIDIL